MRRPGDRLRALASRVFDAETMERLIDPIIADLQMEYDSASHARAIWRRRWMRGVAYAAVLYVAARSMRVFFALTIALTALFELPPLLQMRFTMARAWYLVPQALVVSVPIALTLATAWAPRTSNSFHRAPFTTIWSGAACAAFLFVTLAWWVPAANQAFRVSVFRELGGVASPPPGLHEMAIGELREQMKWATTVRADWRFLEFTYYWRWAFPFASLSLPLLLVGLRRCGATRRSMLLAALPIVFGYYLLMFVGRAYAIGDGALPIAVYVWMPNAVTLLIAAALVTLRTRHEVAG